MNFFFPKSARLLKHSQYQRINQHNHRFPGRWIVVEYRKSISNEQSVRLGITVTKRYGKSHDRNRFKRLVREAFRMCRGQIPSGIDLQVRPKQSHADLHLSDIQADFAAWIDKVSNKKD